MMAWRMDGLPGCGLMGGIPGGGRISVGLGATAAIIGALLVVTSLLLACVVIPSIWFYGWPRPSWRQAASHYFASLPWFNSARRD